jgi:hypothetical protein
MDSKANNINSKSVVTQYSVTEQGSKKHKINIGKYNKVEDGGSSNWPEPCDEEKSA